MASDRHVRRTGDDYAQALANLLPTGLAWPRESTSLLMKFIKGLAQYWGTVDGRAADLLEIEADPRYTRELLDDWERNFGLPDPGLGNQPEFIRHKLLVHRMTLQGGSSRQFFIDLAAYFGFSISITEYSPFICGISRCGDTRPLNPDDPKRFRWEIGPIENRFVWTVTALNSSAPLVEYLFQRFKPAHTAVVFKYYSVSPDLIPTAASRLLTTTAPNLTYEILSPLIAPPRYDFHFISHAPEAVLITRVQIIDYMNLNLTSDPPSIVLVRNRFPGGNSLTLSTTAPSVVKT